MCRILNVIYENLSTPFPVNFKILGLKSILRLLCTQWQWNCIQGVNAEYGSGYEFNGVVVNFLRVKKWSGYEWCCHNFSNIVIIRKDLGMNGVVMNLLRVQYQEKIWV